MEYRVLVVDGEPKVLGGLERLLRLSGFEVVPPGAGSDQPAVPEPAPHTDVIVTTPDQTPAQGLTFRRRSELPRAHEPAEADAPAADEATDGIRVLVVDDDVDTREALAKLLRLEGMIVDQAGNGAAALQAVSRHVPDAVISDLSMPTMGGLELCENLRELHPDVPVVLVTAFGDMEAVVLGMRAGAHDFLTKPLDVERVLASILEAVERRVLRLAKQRELRLSNESAAASDERRSGVHAAASVDVADEVLVRREQLAKVANELRTINERLVISSIREQEQAEEELRQRAQLDALLANLGEGVIIADGQGRIRLVNRAARRILGIEGRPTETVAQFHQLVAKSADGSPLPNPQRPLARALAGEDFADQEMSIVRPDGNERRVLTCGTSVESDDGTVERAIVVFRDVTDLRRLERHREEYTALISHDLRTPLSSIQLLAQTLKRGDMPADRNAAVAERIARNAARMTTMVEEILEASRLEASTLELQLLPSDLRTLCEGIVTRLDDGRASRVVIEGDDGPYPIVADVPRLDRALTNLITNALKYSPGDATVRLALRRGNGELRVDVVDRGVGMTTDEVARLFDRFYRAPTSKHAAAGIGLGLYITKLLVQAHRGRIEVESAPGEGSTFSVVLPCRKEAP